MEVGLQDLKWWGHKYTWWNKQERDDKIESKLDRVLVNGEWLTEFPLSEENFLLLEIFDHSPNLVSIGEVKNGRPKPFRFFDM